MSPRLAPSIDPDAVTVWGDAGRVIVEDWTVERLDGFVLTSACSLHSALAFAEKHYSETDEPVRVVNVREVEAARVGWLP